MAKLKIQSPVKLFEHIPFFFFRSTNQEQEEENKGGLYWWTNMFQS